MKKIIFVLSMVLLFNQSFGACKFYADSNSGTANASTPANAANPDSMRLFLQNSVAAGDTIFVLGGDTLVQTAAIDFSARDGSATAIVCIIGLKSTTTNTASQVDTSDYAKTSDSKPIWNAGSYNFKTGQYVRIENIKFVGNASPVITCDFNNTFFNCEFNQNNSTSAAEFSINLPSYGMVVNCFFTSANAGAITHGGSGFIYGCVFNNIADATNGLAINITGNLVTIANNRFYNCKKAIVLAGNDYSRVFENTYYNCGTDVSATDAMSSCFINELHDSTKTDSYVWTTQTPSNLWLYNHGDDTRCNDMWDLVPTAIPSGDMHCTAGDPKFQNPPDSLQLQTSSPCLNTGLGPR